MKLGPILVPQNTFRAVCMLYNVPTICQLQTLTDFNQIWNTLSPMTWIYLGRDFPAKVWFVGLQGQGAALKEKRPISLSIAIVAAF